MLQMGGKEKATLFLLSKVTKRKRLKDLRMGSWRLNSMPDWFTADNFLKLRPPLVITVGVQTKQINYRPHFQPFAWFVPFKLYLKSSGWQILEWWKYWGKHWGFNPRNLWKSLKIEKKIKKPRFFHTFHLKESMCSVNWTPFPHERNMVDQTWKV